MALHASVSVRQRDRAGSQARFSDLHRRTAYPSPPPQLAVQNEPCVPALPSTVQTALHSFWGEDAGRRFEIQTTT